MTTDISSSIQIGDIVLGEGTDYSLTHYSDGAGVDHEAIQLTYETLDVILGRDYVPGEDDDNAIVAALIAAGAPDWIRDAEGWADDWGWGLIGPEVADEQEG